MREIRQEFVLIAGIAVVTLLAMWMLGATAWMGLAAYLAWHVVNFLRLLRWTVRPWLRVPFGFGVWELAFDGLQAVELRNRRRKRSLREAIRRLRLVIGGLADAVVLIDQRQCVRWFNPAAKRLLGIGWPKAYDTPVAELIGRPHLADKIASALDFQPFDMPSPVNGAVILRIEVFDLHRTGQRLLIARDITKTYHIERLRKDFVANVSHELRTPLTVFRGYLETLADDLGEHPDLAGPVNQLSLQATRMQDLVNDLLDLSRLESTEQASLSTPVAVPELIYAAAEEAAQLTGAGSHEIVLKVDPGLHLAGNASILKTVVSNLIFNAVRHTGSGTRIVVEWGIDDGGALFRVTDNGPGIAAHHLPRLTERFYRADRGRSRGEGGTGLGLAIVKHALDRHGAELQIESAPGQGACFTCRFPPLRVLRRYGGTEAGARAVAAVG